jgi:lysyl-tRNA synthetase class 2
VREQGGLDGAPAADVALRAAVYDRGVDPQGMSRGKLMDEVFKAYVEPALVGPVFVMDFPLELSPLAKPKRGDPTLAERFEFFALGRELANAFSELNDPDDQRRRLEAQAMPKPRAWTKTTSGRSSTGCHPRAAWGSASIASS